MQNKKILKKFVYWINERHMIYLKRLEGKKYPWTKDAILREYKFTNVFRQLDAVTQQWTGEYIAHADRPASEVFRNLVVFRMFNWYPTFLALGGWRAKSLGEQAMKNTLYARASDNEKVFTGAYIITNNGLKDKKTDLVAQAVTEMCKDSAKIVKEVKKHNTIAHAVKVLSQYPMVGPFIAYEIATDLRHTHILCDAKDILTWANPGPGAKRGLNRIFNRKLTFSQSTDASVAEMEALMVHVNWNKKDHVPELEMRDIEHSLCEFDKYMRVFNGEGRPRSKYVYRGEK